MSRRQRIEVIEDAAEASRRSLASLHRQWDAVDARERESELRLVDLAHGVAEQASENDGPLIDVIKVTLLEWATQSARANHDPRVLSRGKATVLGQKRREAGARWISEIEALRAWYEAFAPKGTGDTGRVIDRLTLGATIQSSVRSHVPHIDEHLRVVARALEGLDPVGALWLLWAHVEMVRPEARLSKDGKVRDGEGFGLGGEASISAMRLAVAAREGIALPSWARVKSTSTLHWSIVVADRAGMPVDSEEERITAARHVTGAVSRARKALRFALQQADRAAMLQAGNGATLQCTIPPPGANERQYVAGVPVESCGGANMIDGVRAPCATLVTSADLSAMPTCRYCRRRRLLT